MARLAGFPEETFSAMQRIRETALDRFDSLFTPERNLWSLQNLRRFHALFVERFDEGKVRFFRNSENSSRKLTTTFFNCRRNSCTFSSSSRLSPGQKKA
jgi:hypothetical protein